jgi:hypothetical protein
MMRKHINSTPLKNLNEIPFFSWNCLTLQLKNRDVDLVIKDEKTMFKFLHFLIYNMKTIDGNRGSAVTILEAMLEKDMASLKKTNKKSEISDEIIQEFLQINQAKLYNKILQKYKIM